MAIEIKAYNKLSLLHSMELFSVLPESALENLVKVSKVYEYAKGSYVVKLFDPHTHLYYIISGQLCAMIYDVRGMAHNYAHLSSGELLFERAVLGGEVSGTDVLAVEQSFLLKIPANAVRQIAEEYPLIYRELFRIQVRSWQTAFDLVKVLRTKPFKNRLAYILLYVFDRYGEDSPKGRRVQSLITQSELASFADGSRQQLNRQLKLWQSEGIIDISDDGLLYIPDAELLKEIVLSDNDE